jgi:hypothetical protein
MVTTHIPKLKSNLIGIALTAALFLFPSKTFADWACENNFVNIEVARAYLKENPYIIAVSAENEYTQLFKAEEIYMDEELITVSGPIILSWNKAEYIGQRTYILPDSGQIFTGELCGNNHYGYYKPMQAAFALTNLFSSTGGGVYDNHLSFMAFPEPEVFPDVEKGYSSWLYQLPNVVKEYCLWWYANASAGPPVLHELIDSVLSVSEGGRKAPPNIYIDSNHCPGEGCQLGQWKTDEKIVIFDKPSGNKEIGVISEGEIFTAITGDVYLTPLEVILNQTIEPYDSLGTLTLSPGRKYYILSNIGEGHSKIWINGRIMQHEDLYNPTQKWWVKVETTKGITGWILYPDSGCISGADYLE